MGVDKLQRSGEGDVDLGSRASDNCLLRWAYSAVDISDSDNIPETSVAFIDAIILPPLYGNGGKPAEATLVSPADKSENLYNKNITLTWRPALFADGTSYMWALTPLPQTLSTDKTSATNFLCNRLCRLCHYLQLEGGALQRAGRRRQCNCVDFHYHRRPDDKHIPVD